MVKNKKYSVDALSDLTKVTPKYSARRDPHVSRRLARAALRPLRSLSLSQSITQNQLEINKNKLNVVTAETA